MTRENAAAKARRYLTEGRLVLVAVGRYGAYARVRGDGAVYATTWDPATGWRCTCPARTDACAHLLALRLVVAVDLPETA